MTRPYMYGDKFMSLLCVGSVALDSVETPFGKRDNILGGSATHFSVSASFFTGVNLVAVVGNDFPADHLDFLRSRNIDLAGLEVAAGETFRWAGRYGFDLNNAETLETHLNVFADFVPKVPEPWQQPRTTWRLERRDPPSSPGFGWPGRKPASPDSDSSSSPSPRAR